jgi:hypothetical protein
MPDAVVIEDDDELYRRLPSEHVKNDGTISSVAFCFRGEPDPSLSVDLAKLTTPQEVLQRARKPGAGVGVITAGVPRGLGLTVRHDPIREDNEQGLAANPAHTLIEGLTPADRKTKCYLLAEAMTVLIAPAAGS